MLPLRDQLPTTRVPFVNYVLIAMNVAAFIWSKALFEVGMPPARFVAEWGLVPVRLLASPAQDAHTVFTSMFLHDPSGWAHIGGNLLFLWIFGDNVEDAFGHARYLAFYLASGIAAAAAQILIDPVSPIPMIGASGAIAGVLAAYGSLYPTSRITILNPIMPLWFFAGIFWEFPAWLVILEFFVGNLLMGLVSLGSRSGGVAFFAHLGGFVAGLILVRFVMAGRKRRAYDPWHGWKHPTRRHSGPEPRYGGRRQGGPWDW